MINERIEIKELNQKIIHGHLTEGDLNILSKKRDVLEVLVSTKRSQRLMQTWSLQLQAHINMYDLFCGHQKWKSLVTTKQNRSLAIWKSFCFFNENHVTKKKVKLLIITQNMQVTGQKVTLIYLFKEKKITEGITSKLY